MKLILLPFLFLVTIGVKAQLPDYLPEGATWRIDAIGLSTQFDCWYKDQMVCTVEGDSVIGLHTYKKVMAHALYTEYAIFPGGGGMCSAPYIHDELYALVRQDSLRIHIYADNQDKLLYDFDLQVGDVLPITYNNFSDTVMVTGISSLQVGNETRKVFTLNNENEIDTLIEGIGHNWGFIGPMQFFEFYEIDLKCFGSNDTTWYPYLDAVCDYNVSIGEELSNETIQVFPNPTSNGWQIQLPEGLAVENVRLFSLEGKEEEMEWLQAGTGLYAITTNHLNDGVYLLHVQTDRGLTTVLRMEKIK